MAREHETLDEALLGDSFFDDPHPLYRRMRSVSPVFRSEALDTWLVTGHQEVMECLLDSRLSSRGRVAKVLDRIAEPSARVCLRPLYDHFSVGLIHSDPPDHTRIRSLINRPFTPRQVALLEPSIQACVDELLDRVASRGTMDLIADLAFPLPVRVVSDFLGIPIDDQERFKEWSDKVNSILARQHTLESALETQENAVALREFVAGLVEQRRQDPRDDLLSVLVSAEQDDRRLSEMELIQTAATLLIAAHETTTNLIGNGILALLRNPAELTRLEEDCELLDSAIEEFLRYESPLNHFTRIASEPVTLAGREIPEGALVTLSLVAANRDPAVFDDPDRLNVARGDNRHLAFGHGRHFCLGSSLARLEGRVAIGTMLRRFPNLRLAEQRVLWRHDRVLRAAKAIPIDLG